MNTIRFDPFNSRLARDIRNALAESFGDALRQLDESLYGRQADQWLAKDLDHEFAGYIRDRMKRYDRVFKQIVENRILDAKIQALIVWNNQLFFEVHELLERVWQRTSGNESQALKGLIQAAGVYVHLEHNHHPAAAKLAAKSSDRIQKYGSCLSFITNLDMLLDRLKTPGADPPQLLIEI